MPRSALLYPALDCWHYAALLCRALLYTALRCTAGVAFQGPAVLPAAVPCFAGGALPCPALRCCTVRCNALACWRCIPLGSFAVHCRPGFACLSPALLYRILPCSPGLPVLGHAFHHVAGLSGRCVALLSYPLRCLALLALRHGTMSCYTLHCWRCETVLCCAVLDFALQWLPGVAVLC
jgi:hypothetical protein